MASPLPSPRSPSLHRADGHASPFRSSPPLVEEDASAFRSSPRRVEVDASAFPISPARASEDASAPRYEENAAPPAEPPSLEELWKEMDVALWEALPPAERAKIEAEKKAEEEKRTAEQAAWEAYVASERVRQLALWQKARARAVRVAEDARAKALSAVGPKRLIYAWRYVDRVHASSEEEYLLAPDHHTGEIALARRQAANQHLASCEAEEEALCRRAGKRPRTRALVARRKRSCERRGF